MGHIIGMDEKAPRETPLIFIAGPSRGAEIGWRKRVAEFMERKTKANIAFPVFNDGEVLHRDFKKPIAWGYHHLRHALQDGVVMLWFPHQVSRSPSNNGQHHDHPYAINAERALGVCVGAKMYRPRMNVVVGYDLEYPRKKSLLDLLTYWDVGIKPIEGDIKACCAATIKLAHH